MATPARLIKLIETTGSGCQNPESLDWQDNTSRGEWVARPWVNKGCGHGVFDTGILEEESSSYGEGCRKDFFPTANNATKHSHHVKLYEDINLAHFPLPPPQIDMRTQYLEIGSLFAGALQ